MPQVDILEARGYLCVALQIVAADFGFSGNLFHLGERPDGRRLAGAAYEHGLADGVEVLADGLRKAYADGIRAVVDHYGSGGRLTLQHGAGIQFHFLRRKSGARRHYLVNVEHGGGTAVGVFHAVDHVHHAINLFHRVGHRCRPLFEQRGILGEELDDHGLRRAGKIVHHVLQELREFHIKRGFLPLHFGADLLDHFLHAALAVVFQLDGDVSLIGFGNLCQSELHTGTAGSILYFGSRAQDSLYVGDYTIGLREGSAGRHYVVDNEPALIHGRKKVGTDACVAKIRSGNEDDRKGGQHQLAAPQHQLQHAFISAHEPRRDGSDVRRNCALADYAADSD